MRRCNRIKWLGLAPALALALHTDAARACAACFGKSDSPLADAMNWGIFSLMGVVVCVLGGIAGFFIFMARRSAARNAAATPAPAPQGELLVSTQKA
jgi:heme/copper-type cytochrome/quinol oxidase subunit 2